MELRHYIRVLRAHRLLVVTSLIACLTAAAALAWAATPTYSAGTQLFIAASPGAEDAGASYQASVFSQERALSYVHIISSPVVLDAVIDELDLPLTSAELAGKMKASVPTGTVLMDITVDDSSPEGAAAIAAAVAEQFSAFVSRLETPAGAGDSRVTARVTRPADVPTSPISPRKPIYLALGLLFGLVLGVGGAFAREALDRRVRTAEDATSSSGAPVLASVAEGAESEAQPLVVAAEPTSSRAEGYRRLRANVSALVDGKQAPAFVVTGAVAGSGSAVVAANLGVAFAEAGHRVLAIDADLRSPAVAELLDIPAISGLADLLHDDLSPEEVLETWNEDVPLTVVGSGTAADNPGELLASQRLAAFLAEASKRFDVTIVNTPPLLEYSDAAVVARATSGALVVARSDSTRAEDLKAAANTLHAVDVELLGVVLNTAKGWRRGRGAARRRDRAHVPQLAQLDGQRAPGR